MSFMKETISKSLRIWDECVKSDFISELTKGTLPIEKFKNYMVQDSIYLKHYARVYGKAIFHSTNLRDIQIYYSILNFVTDTESAVRINYLSSFGITDDDIEFIQPLRENQNYIDFLLEIAEGGDTCEILMAVLPCMMSYSYIFRKIADESYSSKSQYWDFIQDYADNQYYEDCIAWGKFADRKCENLTDEEKEHLSKIFEKASELELDFWKMAYGGVKMKKGICYVIGAGENYGLDFHPEPDDYVIAADGGLKYLEENNIEVDLVIGDFDTLKYTPHHHNVIQLNPQKDETDMFSAISQGIQLGYKEFRILCGTGGRVDHSFANIQILAYLANRQMQGFLIDRNAVLTVIKDSEYTFDSTYTGYVSIFSISDNCTGVYLENLKYELNNAELVNDFPLGVSNEFIGAEGKIKVENGMLLIIFPRKELRI